MTTASRPATRKDIELGRGEMALLFKQLQVALGTIKKSLPLNAPQRTALDGALRVVNTLHAMVDGLWSSCAVGAAMREAAEANAAGVSDNAGSGGTPITPDRATA